MKMESSSTTLAAISGCQGLSLPHQEPLRAEQRLPAVGTHMWPLCLVAVSSWWLVGTVAGPAGT